jgi:hypothetical protein
LLNNSSPVWRVLQPKINKEKELRAVEDASRADRAGEGGVPVWTPQEGPQRDAYMSRADIIGYGGAAGGGKTSLLVGMAGTLHQRSIIFRRVFPSLRGIIEYSREVFNAENRAHLKDSFNESTHVWRLEDGRTIEFGAVQYEQDRKKYQGQPHDFIGIDEATEFPEATVRFLMGWNRTTTPNQACRVVLTFNPPMDDAGSWVVRFFAPWLDDEHPTPAQDGELRYYAVVDGEEQEFAQPEDIPEGILYRSRTFFHASLRDNPILEATGYGATIDALPEPLRSLLKGNFDAARITDPWQVIPSAWVRAAQARWTPEQPDDTLRSTGLDVAWGGKDKTVIARLYGAWVAPLLKYPGSATPDGPTVAALALPYTDAMMGVSLDVIGGGLSSRDSLVGMGVKVNAINFGMAAPTDARDRSGKLRFRNVRARAYWLLREALDPEHGDSVALPPDPELVADLCALKWSATGGGILIESKDDVRERIGRSPDCGDAVALMYYGVAAALPSGADLVSF